MATPPVLIGALDAFVAIPALHSHAEPQHRVDKAVFETHQNGSQTDQVYARNVRALRRFVWEHWLRRERGEAVNRHSTVEGDSGTTIYQVAPNEDKVWRIVIDRQGEATNFDEGTSRHYSERKEAYSVVRKEHHLLLKDKTGTTVLEL